jgi:hypothetical protein
MMNTGCRMTPQEDKAHDQKYSPRRFLKRMKREKLISTPTYHEIPEKAAITIAMGRSPLISGVMAIIARPDGGKKADTRWVQRWLLKGSCKVGIIGLKFLGYRN